MSGSERKGIQTSGWIVAAMLPLNMTAPVYLPTNSELKILFSLIERYENLIWWETQSQWNF